MPDPTTCRFNYMVHVAVCSANGVKPLSKEHFEKCVNNAEANGHPDPERVAADLALYVSAPHKDPIMEYIRTNTSMN